MPMRITGTVIAVNEIVKRRMVDKVFDLCSGAKVRVVDPRGQHEGEALVPGVNWIDDSYEAAADADALEVGFISYEGVG